jgi:hypothetical protein
MACVSIWLLTLSAKRPQIEQDDDEEADDVELMLSSFTNAGMKIEISIEPIYNQRSINIKLTIHHIITQFLPASWSAKASASLICICSNDEDDDGLRSPAGKK